MIWHGRQEGPTAEGINWLEVGMPETEALLVRE